MTAFCRKGKITITAMLLSFALHIAVLGIFSLVSFSSSQTNTFAASGNSISLQNIKALSHTSRTVAKPKVKKLYTSDKQPRLMSKNENLVTDKDLPGKTDETNLHTSDTSLSSVPLFSCSTEFFGSPTDLRKICFVVDCSGSMKGTFGIVRRNLKDSISRLRQDQYFDIIFFKGEDLFDFGNKHLVRASENRKIQAFKFIDSVSPSGTTNAAKALNYAMGVKDSAGNAAQLIYFLTDGLDMNDNNMDFSKRIEKQRKKLAPSTVINTIGFWTELYDRSELIKVAGSSGGKFVNIE
ncbi:MAG: VWA domain-containing protein [Sedimentisphaerales bacterium]|nr:VWA domain-containing protein [Sedimentisphaerales bacterium]